MAKRALLSIYDAWIVSLGALLGSVIMSSDWKTILWLFILTALLYGWADVYDPTRNPPEKFLSDYDLETLPEQELRSMGIPQEKIDIAKGRVSKTEQ